MGMASILQNTTFIIPRQPLLAKPSLYTWTSTYAILPNCIYIVCLFGCREHLPTYPPPKDSRPYYQPYSDPYEEDSPPPLSPIEELDDDSILLPPRRSSDPGLPPPLLTESSKPDSFSLAQPDKEIDITQANDTLDPLEQRSELLFSRQHLKLILADLKLSLKFAEFLRMYRPDSVPILAYYLDAVKALKTIKYAESIINGLEPIPGHEFTSEVNSATMAWVMEDKSDRALDILLKDDFPAFIAFIYVQTVDIALVDRITGREDPKSRSVADGLAEVFVLSDPARPDNPIVLTSEGSSPFELCLFKTMLIGRRVPPNDRLP